MYGLVAVVRTPAIEDEGRTEWVVPRAEDTKFTYSISYEPQIRILLQVLI